MRPARVAERQNWIAICCYCDVPIFFRASVYRSCSPVFLGSEMLLAAAILITALQLLALRVRSEPPALISILSRLIHRAHRTPASIYAFLGPIRMVGCSQLRNSTNRSRPGCDLARSSATGLKVRSASAMRPQTTFTI